MDEIRAALLCAELSGLDDRLARFHANTASLRRYLISYKLLERDADGARYWRPV